MRSFLALVGKDLKGYFDQPTGYILLVVFVAVLTYLFFFQSTVVTGEASLRPLFAVYLPWVLAVFVPAATMRLVAEEERDGTLETLLTYPIRDWTIVLAKFLAGMLFVSAGVGATVLVPVLLQTAGSLDIGATIAQYVGSLFLTASLVAIGLFSSSLTRNQIVAFIVGLTIAVTLTFIGQDFVLAGLPPALAGLLQGLSPFFHFSNIARGVLDLRDIVYFALIVFTFLTATYFALRAKTLSHQSSQYRRLQLGVAGLVVLSVLAGWFGDSIRGRWDLTAGKVYTLSPASEEMVAGLDDFLTIRLFSSKGLPPPFSRVDRDVNDFLGDLASKSRNVRLVRSFPSEDDQAAWWASQVGVAPQELSAQGRDELQIKRIYLGLTLAYRDRQEVIPFIDSVETLEYRVATLIHKMTQSDRKTVAFLTGHGEKSKDVDFLFLANQLALQYEVKEIDAAQEADLALDGIDLLIVPGPTEEFPEHVQDALHRYLSNGGSLLALVEPVNIGVGQDQTQLFAQKNEHSLDSFLNRYGVKVHDNLVSDARLNETITLTRGVLRLPVPYPYWPRVRTVRGRVPGDVESIVMAWAGSLDVDESANGGPEVIRLLETSRFAAQESQYLDVTPGGAGIISQDALDQRLMAVAVTGRASLPATGSGGPQGPTYRLAVFGDSDWLTDFMVSRAPENMGLGLNVIDWLAQEDALAAIRSKLVPDRHLLFTSRTHRNLVQYGNIVGVPLFIVLVGGLRFMWRRKVASRVYGRER